MKRKTHRLLKSSAAGAIAGLAASWVMNEFQSIWAEAAHEITGGGESQAPRAGDEEAEGPGGGGEDATVKTAQMIAHAVKRELPEREKKWAGPAVHYAFGTFLGSVYGILAETMPVARAGYGTAYGSAVWLLADEIAVPASGLSGSSLKASLNAPPMAHVKALASHLVYGLATDLCRRAILR